MLSGRRAPVLLPRACDRTGTPAPKPQAAQAPRLRPQASAFSLQEDGPARARACPLRLDFDAGSRPGRLGERGQLRLQAARAATGPPWCVSAPGPSGSWTHCGRPRMPPLRLAYPPLICAWHSLGHRRRPLLRPLSGVGLARARRQGASLPLRTGVEGRKDRRNEGGRAWCCCCEPLRARRHGRARDAGGRTPGRSKSLKHARINGSRAVGAALTLHAASHRGARRPSSVGLRPRWSRAGFEDTCAR